MRELGKKRWVIVGVLLALAAPATAVTLYRGAIQFSQRSSWVSATGAVTGEGIYDNTGVPLWHTDGGVEQAMTLPVQTGAGGKFLGTDGTTATWQTPLSGGGGSIFVLTTAPLGGGGGFGSSFTLTCATCLTGSLTSGRIPVASSATALVNSNLTASGSTFGLSAAGTLALSGNVNRLQLTQAVQTGVTPTATLLVQGGAHTAMTASAEYIDVNFNINRILTWATGNITTERPFIIQAPTLAFAGASTVGTAATVTVTGPVIAGTNATITQPLSLWLQTGNMGMAPSATIRSTSAAAAGATGMELDPNVADGAGSIGLLVNTQQPLANAGAIFFELANAGIARLKAVVNSTDGVVLKDGGGSSAVSLSSNLGSSLCYGAACYTAGSGSLTVSDGTGGQSITGGVTTFNGNAVPSSDATRSSGTSGARWAIVGAKQTIPGQATLAFSATPNFDCTTNRAIHIGPVTANITGATFTAGSAPLSGTECIIVFEKDATAGAFTIAFTGNVRWPTNPTFTTSARSLVVMTFVWDNNLNTPAWVSIHAAQVI